MNKKYAAIKWADEPKNYSSVKVARINYDSVIIKEESQLLDQIFDIHLDKLTEETSTGKFLQIGSRARISKVVAELASAASDLSLREDDQEIPTGGRTSSRYKNGKRKEIETTKIATSIIGQIDSEVETDTYPGSAANSSSAYNNGIHNSSEASEMPGNELQIGCVNDHPADTVEDYLEVESEKDRTIKALQEKLRQKNRCIKKLRIDLAQQEQEQENSVDIGEGIMISKKLATELKTDYRHNPGIFLRKLMERSGLFSLEEIASSSVTGQRYRDGLQRPRLDFVKFKACKDFTIKKCKLHDQPLKMVQFEKSVANICTDARKRIKKINT